MQIVSPRPAQTALMNPLELPDLEAWYDSLDPITLLASDGNIVTDGGTVCLWKDKSGNSGVNCFVSAGASGNYAGVADAVAVQPSTELELVARASCPWSDANDYALIAKYAGAGVRSFIWRKTASGVLTLGISVDGTNLVTAISSAGVAFADYAKGWVKVTWRKSDGRTQFWTAPNSATEPSSWTQLGTDQTVASGSDIFNSAAVLEMGARSTGTANILAGTLHNCILRKAIDGAATLNVDFTTAPTKLANGDTFVCTTGQTVTLNSSGATGARIAGERDLFQGTAANRPVYLKYEGTKYGYLNATSGNSFTCPTLAMTTDLDLQGDVAFADWAPAAAQGIVSKYGGAGNRGFRFELGTTGLLNFIWSTDGTATTTVSSSARLDALANNARKRVRCILDADDGGVYTIKFFTSDDGVTWTQLGTTTTGGATTSVFNSTALLEVGQYAQSQTPAAAKFYSASVSATLPADPLTDSGTPLRLFNPALYQSGTTFTASTGEVWTLNGGAHIVTRTGLYFPGATQSLKTAAFGLVQPETVYLSGAQNSWSNGLYIMDGGTTNTGVIAQLTTTPNVVINAGSSVAGNTGWAVKTFACITALFNGAASLLRVNRGTATTGNPGTNNMNGFTLAAIGSTGASNASIFVSEVAIYSAAHPTATQDRMALAMGRKHSFAV